MNNITIRAVIPEDLNTLRHFELRLIDAERSFDQTIKREPVQYYNLEAMIQSPDVYLAVAELNHKIIACGYAYLLPAKPHEKHANYASLGFMYVDPSYRGKGLNLEIINHLKSWCLSKAIYELRLEVYFDNHSAIKAYEKAGFTKYRIEMRLDISG